MSNLMGTSPPKRGAGETLMLEWVFFLSIAFAAFFFGFAYYTNNPSFYAVAGIVLLFASWQITSDGGIWRETVKQITTDGTNYTITQSYDTNSTISVRLEDNPVTWGLNTLLFFAGVLFTMYSITEGIGRLKQGQRR
jgi:hypothetical protein